jgi:hypothetical protein
MECKHGLDTRWCAVCIHGPLPATPTRPLPPAAGGLPDPDGTAAIGYGLRDREGDEAGRVRYACACGAVGAWVLSRAQACRAHGDHMLDAHAAATGGSQGRT